jgi:phospholipid-binding lipoprotein MlaA
MQTALNRFLLPMAFLALPLLGGCATVDQPSSKDPLESYNRTMFAINDKLDEAVIKPVAQGYKAVTPNFFRAGVTNFFNNVSDLAVFVNDFLQGKPKQGTADAGRFLMNTTVGMLGLFDVATSAGLPKHQEDFGQTMAVWGWDSSTYVVLPLLGPSTVRDSWGLVGDTPLGLYYNLHTTNTKLAEIFAFETVNTRTNLLAASNILEAAALDRYAFLRDAYLQRRRNLIYDGNPPPLPEDE